MIIPITTPIEKVRKELPITVTDSGGSKWKSAQQCLRKYYYMHEINEGEGITKSNMPHPKMLLGTAFHAAMETYYDIVDKGFRVGPGHATEAFNYKEAEHINQLLVLSIANGLRYIMASELEDATKAELKEKLINTVDLYHDEYTHELFEASDGLKVTDTELFLEGNVNGNKVTARIDVVGTYGGTHIIADHKTTSKPWSLYVTSLKRDLSLMGYVYLARKHLKEPVQMLINGVVFRNTKAFSVAFQRDLISYSEADMLEYERSMDKVHSDITVCKVRNEWPQNGQYCVKDMVVCEFEQPCNNPASVGLYEKKERG